MLCVCLLSLSRLFLSRGKLADSSSLLMGGWGDETRSYRQISAYWNPIGKVIYIVILKSTCDLIREPIHNPDTLHSYLTMFCKQAWSLLFMCLCYWSLALECNVQICVSGGHFSAEFHSTVMFVLRSFGWPQHIFCINAQFVSSSTVETDNSLVTYFSLNENKNVEMTNTTVMSLLQRC